MGNGSRDIQRPWDRTWKEHTSRVVFSQFFNKHHVPHCTYWLDKHLLVTCHVQALCQALSVLSDGPCPSGACSLTKLRVQEQAGQEADTGQMEGGPSSCRMWHEGKEVSWPWNSGMPPGPWWLSWGQVPSLAEQEEDEPGTPRKEVAKAFGCPPSSNPGQELSRCPHVYLLSVGMVLPRDPPQAHARPLPC